MSCSLNWLSGLFYAVGKLKDMRIKRYLLFCETPNFTSGFYRKKMRAEFLQNISKAADNLFHISELTFKSSPCESDIIFSLKSQRKFAREAITKEITEQDTAWCLNSLHHNQIFIKCKFILV